MLQIKRLKFITKCSIRDPGTKREPEGVMTMRGKLKLKLEPNGNLQPPAAAETKERWFLYIRRPFTSFSPPPSPRFPFSLTINSSPILLDACAHCCSDEAEKVAYIKQISLAGSYQA